ncbi:Glycerophosphodiester phosphodiesterase, cytoplasmic [BD1-7 clade bacterium]|uniref:Glycerophosphodiester phosphodiesterase, cytoplasmic n=1 Tax=BD1-7 clade bacterium TaxID=2029982 RepID=A0A5S9MRJ8_9GAMM|nr:Glycerophosphodiester phosphodiesterase, cytoplasmic [BD1-7 clade bacterium]CAA0084560.1 Glycerophosphodiester phosphodiesterase, cytoplasmic [BD1-7 clade bacterium]
MKNKRVWLFYTACAVLFLVWFINSKSSHAMGALVAHRGAAEYGPENTLAPVKVSNQKAITWTETDVMLSKDDEAVIMHDDTVDRTTNGKGNVRDMTLAELQALDAGSWFHEDFTGEPVPSLDDWITLHLALGMHPNLELKPNDPDTRLLAEKVLEAIQTTQLPMNQMHISSFDKTALQHMRDIGYTGEMSYLATILPLNWKSVAESLNLDFLNLNGSLLLGSTVRNIIDNGYGVAAWTVNDCANAERLRRHGVSSIISDRPAEISPTACADTTDADIQAAEDTAQQQLLQYQRIHSQM